MSYRHEIVDPSEYNYTQAYREFGNGEYLAKGESFDVVVARDRAILEALGVTAQEVGGSLRTLLASYNEFYRYRKPGPQELVPGVVVENQTFELGQEFSPYLKGVSSNVDWRVTAEGLNNGNKAYHPLTGPTFISDMLPEMIAQLGFFEGSVFYGLQPEWVTKIHELVQQHKPQPYAPVFEREAWTSAAHLASATWYSPEKTHSYLRKKREWASVGEQFPAGVIRRNTIHKEVIAGKIKAVVAKGDIEFNLNPWRNYIDRDPTYWAFLYAMDDVIIPPDATLMGLPFDMYNCRFHRGDMDVWKVDPNIPAPCRVG